jgi:L-fucose isomerase-like protein
MRQAYVLEHLDDDGPLVRILAMRDQVLAIADDHGLDAVSMKTFPSLTKALGAYGSLASSYLADVLPYASESDIHGAISTLLLHRASREARPPYLTEFTVRHPDDDNAVLMWHSGAPLWMKHPDVPVRLGKHWILPGELSGMTHFRLKDGPLTVLRFDGDASQYKLALGEGDTIDGPETLNNYLWMRVDDWPRWERTLMDGPFIHHCAMSYGHDAQAVRQAVRFVDGLDLVEL